MKRNSKISRLLKNSAKGVTIKATNVRAKTNQSTTMASEGDIKSLDVTATVLDCGALQFTTKGRWVTLNTIMRNQHWAKSVGIKDIITNKVRDCIKDFDIRLDQYFISLQYNSRMDDHNTVMMPKYYTDAIKTEYAKNRERRLLVDEKGEKILIYKGIIVDDDKRYSKGTFLYPNPKLEHNTYIITYYPASYFQKYFQDMSKEPIFDF